MKRALPTKLEKPPKHESELGRRLRAIKAKIVASGTRLYESDEEVLRDLKERRAGNIQTDE